MGEVPDNNTNSKNTVKKEKDKTINDGVQQIKGKQKGKKPSPKPNIPNNNPDPTINMVMQDLSGQK